MEKSKIFNKSKICILTAHNTINVRKEEGCVSLVFVVGPIKPSCTSEVFTYFLLPG